MAQCHPWPEGGFPEEDQDKEKSVGFKGREAKRTAEDKVPLDFWAPLPVTQKG